MRERNGTTWALAAALLAAAILSFALVTPWAASAETHAASLTALEEKQSTVPLPLFVSISPVPAARNAYIRCIV